ncbi:ribosomal RNA-processing protein 8 isoform X2 [Danaus plexippus]|uniref:ribosomal RNA-processing protein 8 isoform X2 n=1 Tax=Danaus plexippus TaxID=13037 RepID=UPI002AB15D51|nr:ribosomal RNA-processing protein 8 isoform X2 [Danaus plexippus]
MCIPIMGKMFNIPEWEDTPDNIVSFPMFEKEEQTNENENMEVTESPKLTGGVKPKFKTKNLSKKVNNANNLIKNKDKVDISNKKSTKKKIESSKKKENLYDTDKLDELTINEKKRKLDLYKGDDMEKILFNENTEIETNECIKPDNSVSNHKNKSSKKESILPKVELLKEKKKKKKKKSKQAKGDQVNSDNNMETDNKINEKVNQPQSMDKKLKKKVEKRKSSVLKDGSVSDSEDTVKRAKKVKETIVQTKDDKKKVIIKTLLQKNNVRNSISVNSNKLRERMMERLKAAQFRYLNEKLYTSSGSDARQLFQEDPGAFQVYHEGYQQQVKRWPIKPLDVIVKRIQKMPKSYAIADLGCGEAELSTRVVQKVRSFDLVSTKPCVETCDMAHTPLLSASMDVAVYCLALMGTDLTQYLIEANRILKVGGHLLIAEVESRFHDVDTFTSDVQKLGFSLKKIDKSQKVFVFMEFTKARDPPAKKGKLPNMSLKPCVYKKR